MSEATRTAAVPARRLRPVRILVVPLLGAALALAGCAGGGGDSGSSKGYASDAKAGSGAGSSKAGTAAPRKPAELKGVHIVRTARLSVRVKDVSRALDDARARTEAAGGIVGSENTDRDGHGRERTLVTLRVPQDAYQELLDGLSSGGRLLRRSVTAKDVTDQVVDVESRVKSQRAGLARLRELMSRATKLGDVVALESELNERQAELESLLARRDALKDRTTLATITLRLSENPPPAAADDGPGLTDALSGGWHAFVTALHWVGLALAAVLPFAAVLAAGLLLWRRAARRKPAAREPEPEQGEEPEGSA